MSESYIGQIQVFGFNFAPRYFATCSGQTLPINTNQALFSLLGTTYGGNGTTTFQLPDLRGRTMVGQGQSPGLSSYSWGQRSGTETATLTLAQMPTHTHSATFTPTTPNSSPEIAAQVRANSQTPAAGSKLGRAIDGAPTPSGIPLIYAPAGTTPAVKLGGVNLAGTVSIGTAGSGLPVDNRSPYNTLTPCICLQGIFPSRN